LRLYEGIELDVDIKDNGSFGVDMLMNGSIDMDQASYDNVKVTINP
jgi:hypothetical protein